jgi:uncharacterized DUF497 family protein
VGIRFEWDDAKAAENIAKHGVSFVEAKEVFADPFELAVRDDSHSLSEDRWSSIGQTFSGRMVVVSYTESGDTIRIISARRPTKTERIAYEENAI